MAFLKHDMTPMEPSASYEPSHGEPTRDTRLKGHTLLDPSGTCFMLDSPTRVATKEKPPLPSGRRKRTDNSDPGFATTAHEFFAGKHSSKYSREPTGGLKAMFDNPDRMRERAKQDRELNRQYIKANTQALKQKQRRREEEQKYEIIRSQSHLTTDPWERDRPRVQPNARVPRKNEVAKGKVYNKDSSQSYASIAFGKGGAGAPMRDANGQIVTRRSNTVSSMKDFQRGESYLGKSFGQRASTNPRLKATVSSQGMFNDSTGDAYNDQVFGKVGVAGRPRQTKSGNIVARHKTVLEAERHHLDVPGDSYNDKVFKQKNPVRVVNGEVKASRRTLQHQLEETHKGGQGGIYEQMERSRNAKLDAPPAKMSKDDEFRGRLMQHAPLSTSIHK